ncbi:IS66 family transposase [Palleronia sp. LCG004]|uniref:IS66 family transposase n=1 Tax=Palleronia sp. LCG004 TaxID=3079304 RepID=UPI00397C274A
MVPATPADAAILSRTAGRTSLVPPRRNTQPWKRESPGAVGRNEALRAIRRLGRAIWRRWSGSHRRSRVETTVNCFKLLGRKLVAVRHRHRTDGGSLPHLRKADRRPSDPDIHPESLHRPRHPRHSTRRLTLILKRESWAFRSSVQLSLDDTPVQILAPGTGKTRPVRLWTYVRIERPWSVPAPPSALYRFSEDRKGRRSASPARLRATRPPRSIEHGADVRLAGQCRTPSVVDLQCKTYVLHWRSWTPKEALHGHDNEADRHG